MAKAVGVGGIFLKARDPIALAAWYAAYLGIQAAETILSRFSSKYQRGKQDEKVPSKLT